MKGLIRQKESLGAIRYMGLPDKNAHFLNLPFYETGTIKKSKLSQNDIDIMIAKIEEIKPHQIYALVILLIHMVHTKFVSTRFLWL